MSALRFARSVPWFLAVAFFLPATVSATTCVTAATQSAAEAIVSTRPLPEFALRKICDATARNRCVASSNASDAANDVMCCAPNTPGAAPGAACPTAAAGKTGSTAARPVTSGAFTLPACIEDGNCQLDDIVRTGASVANFLFGLSGAVFLLIFVYAGFLYLIAGESSDVSKAKKMLTDATIGMVLMFGAGTLIRFVQKTISTPVQEEGAPQQSPCEIQFGAQGYACVHVPGASQRERKASRPDCKPNLCTLSGQRSMLCCPVVGTGALPAPTAQEERGPEETTPSASPTPAPTAPTP